MKSFFDKVRELNKNRTQGEWGIIALSDWEEVDAEDGTTICWNDEAMFSRKDNFELIALAPKMAEALLALESILNEVEATNCEQKTLATKIRQVIDEINNRKKQCQ